MQTRVTETNDSIFSISVPTSEAPNLVVCPKCSGCAKVILFDEKVRLSCQFCGHNQDADQYATRTFYWHDTTPTDSYFGIPLWLQVNCLGHSLWAFNTRHLDFLEKYVSANLRERNRDTNTWQNSNLASRLPKWIKSANNREAILKAIEKLKLKAQA